MNETLAMETALLRLARMEAMITALLRNLRPTMTFAEVKHTLGYKSNKAVYVWLEQNGITSKQRRYDRARVIAAHSK